MWPTPRRRVRPGSARVFLGSTACQPVVAGNPAGNIFAYAIRVVTSFFPVSAGCRDQQAASLRSPEQRTRKTRTVPASEFQMQLSCASLDATNLSRLQDRFYPLCISLGDDHRHPNAHVENLVHFLCIDVSILLQDLEDTRRPPAFCFNHRITI